MIDNLSAAFMGLPLYFKGNSYVYPPKVKDVANRDYEKFITILTMSMDDIKEIFKDENLKELPTPYKIMYKNYIMDEQIRDLTTRAFEFFLHEPVTFLVDKGIIILGDLETLLKNGTKIEDIHYIEEKDYFAFQNLIRTAIGMDVEEREDINPNEDPRVARLKQKFKESHKIVAKVKEKKGETLKFNECLVAICCMGIGITPLNIGELSYCAISPLMRKFQNKETYDHLSMGAMMGTIDTKKNTIEYWIGNSK